VLSLLQAFFELSYESIYDYEQNIIITTSVQYFYESRRLSNRKDAVLKNSKGSKGEKRAHEKSQLIPLLEALVHEWLLLRKFLNTIFTNLSKPTLTFYSFSGHP
jgi:hypothetical protein